MWIFFASVFNAMWEESTLMPSSRNPDGPGGQGRMLSPSEALRRTRPAIAIAIIAIGQDPVTWSRHHTHTRPVSSPLLCKVILVVHKI